MVTMRCHNGNKPCAVPPAPWSPLMQDQHTQLTVTKPTLGRGDGVIFPESHFPSGTTNIHRKMFSAASDRPPLRGEIK